MSKTIEVNIEAFTCADCGIKFGLDSQVIVHWKKSHKKFVCPNGHRLTWGNKEIDSSKETEALRLEVAELKAKLAKALTKVDLLTTELELWRPNSKD